MDKTNQNNRLTEPVITLASAESVRPLLTYWQRETNGDGLGVEIDPDYVLRDVARMVADPDAVVLGLVRDKLIVGFMGVESFPSPTGPQRLANEHYLYVAPKYRGMGAVRLIKSGLRLAAERSCDHLLLNASHLASKQHDSVCKLYERLGAKPFETTYIMEVK